MSNSLRLTKKALTIAVAAATILWTAGLAAFVPATVQAAEYGDLIKGETLSTVYYYGSDGQRYSFPNEKTYFSWFEDFDDVVEISDEELADITLAGNIVYRPGSRWVKITSDDKVYAVSVDGSIHWVESEEVAEGLAGSAWNQFIDDVPDVFFVDYTVGDSLVSAEEGYNGMLWTDGDDTFLVWDGEVRMVSSAGLSANNFQDGMVLDGDGFDMDSLESGDDVTGELAYLTDSAQMVEEEEFEESADVSVSVSGSPSASTLIAGQGVADLLHVTLTNNSDSSVNLTKLSLTRIGVSSDTTLSNLYLFDGYVRLTDAATISSGKVTFNDSSGIVNLGAGESETLTVRSDIAAGTSGQTVGLKLASSDDLGFNNGEASGSFPLSGSTHTIATSPSTFATLDFTGSTTPTAASIDPQEAYRVWERTLSVGTNEVELYAARFRNIGSIDADDVGNWMLYVGGVARGSAVAMEDDDGYITFDLSGAPVRLTTGNHQVKAVADVIGGSGRTVTVGLRNSADFLAMDEDYDQPVRPTVGTLAFSAMDAGAQLVNSGSLTFTKATNSPSGDVTETASGVVLGRWTAKAFGESMKVESLRFAFLESDGDDVSLRNGAVYVNGSQVGSTASLEANAGAGTDYTEYTFGSSVIVVPGSPATVEIRADIYDADGNDGIQDSDTIRAEISDMNGLLNVQQKTSGGYVDAPDGAAVTANTLTVTPGALTVARNGSYANQTTIDPKSAYKIGSFTVTAGTTEGVNLTDINVDFDAASDSSEPAAGDLYNLYVKYGPSNDMVTTSTRGSIAETANSWSINYALDAGETIYFDLYADIDTAITTGEAIQVSFDVNGTTVLSGASPTTNEVAGQVITMTAGSFSAAVDGSTPVARIVGANQTIEAAKFKFTAQNDNYTVDQMELEVETGGANAAGVINRVELYDGTTLLGSGVMSQTGSNDDGDGETDGAAGTSALVTGLSISIPAGTSKTVTAKLVLNNIGTGAGLTQQNLLLSLDAYRQQDSQGTRTTVTTDYDGNQIRAYKSIPTVSHVDLTNSTLVNGQAVDVYKFTVTANSNGPIALKQLKFPISFTDGGDTTDTLEMESWKFYKNGTDISTSSSAVLIVDEDADDIEDGTGAGDAAFTGGAADTTVVVIWDTSEEVIAAGETVTYTLRATPQGFDLDSDTGDEDYFSVYMAGDSTHNSGVGTAGLTDACLDDPATVWQLGDTAAIGTACTTADTNSSDYNFIWSDSSLSGHDGSETTAADWANGFLVLNLDLSGETWAR